MSVNSPLASISASSGERLRRREAVPARHALADLVVHVLDLARRTGRRRRGTRAPPPRTPGARRAQQRRAPSGTGPPGRSSATRSPRTPARTSRRPAGRQVSKSALTTVTRSNPARLRRGLCGEGRAEFHAGDREPAPRQRERRLAQAGSRPRRANRPPAAVRSGRSSVGVQLGGVLRPRLLVVRGDRVERLPEPLPPSRSALQAAPKPVIPATPRRARGARGSPLRRWRAAACRLGRAGRDTPSARSALTLRANWGRDASGPLTAGSTTIGMPMPVCSASTASAYVSATPSAHWLSTLNVAGATTIASGTRDRGMPGLRCTLRTGEPVSASMSAASKNASADGVAITCTVQPRSMACLTRVPSWSAGPAPQATTDRTQLLRAMKID